MLGKPKKITVISLSVEQNESSWLTNEILISSSKFYF
jgi:hypothetical protein